MIKRYLEHFTQDEVDKSPREILTKDLPYGGNRPYVVGTVLRNSTNGEYVLWRKGGTEAHRLCIEHAPNELVEWTLATETMSSATIDLQQLTRDYPFGKIKRIGMIPLDARESSVPSTYYDRAYCVSTDSASPDLNDMMHCFSLSSGKCELKLTQTTPLTQPTYCEIEALLYAPYFTDKIYFTNLSFALSPRGVVFYCVYELYDGFVYYSESDAIINGTTDDNYHPMFRIPFTKGILKDICVNNNDLDFPSTYSVRVNLYKYKFLESSVHTDWLWYQDRTENTRNCFFNVGRSNFPFEYGTLARLTYTTSFNNKHRGVDGYFRFTSERFNF